VFPEDNLKSVPSDQEQALTHWSGKAQPSFRLVCERFSTVYDAADWRCQLRRVPGAKKACRSRPDGAEAARGVLGPPIEAGAPNVVWAIDFQFDSTTDGKTIKIASMTTNTPVNR
jgi:hypothetical protein